MDRGDAFLTKSTYYRVVQIYHKDIDENFIQNLRELDINMKKLIDSFHITSKELLFQKVLERKEFLYLVKTKTKKDLKKYVFSTGIGLNRYHAYKSCSSLINSSYEDYEIPKEIQGINNPHLTENFRSWFKKSFSENSDLLFLVQMYNTEFALEHQLEPIEKFEMITIPKNSDLKITKQFFPIVNKSEEVDALIREYALVSLNESIEIHPLKYKALDLLREYFYWNYNNVEHHEEFRILEDFGIQRCQICDRKMKESNQDQ